ncbi:MAG: nitrous oxide reductase family maturation protein [Paenibacillus sp.]|nr:nitrous oxide reductase family maturation protein [Paenibacillus sp.]
MDKKTITIGISSGDLIGNTNMIIQAGIDYLSNLGGGTLKLLEGSFTIASPIHLRSNVSIEGIPGKTILIRSEEHVTPLAADADQHERQVTVQYPERIGIGQTVTIRNADRSLGFLDTVATVIGKEGNTLMLDRELYATISMEPHGIVSTQSSVISGYDCEQVQLRNLTIEGGREHNSLTNGCRNAGIFLFGANDVLIEYCTVSHYNGDGISYQHCSDITVQHCVSSNNGGKGIHPGSGTLRTTIRHCEFENNDSDGIFFCWRVQHSLVEFCKSADNKMSGFSIGHKDTHNMIRHNRFSSNRFYGVFFRNELEPMAANYNRVEHNVIENNGSIEMGFVGIRIRGFTHDVTLGSNRIVFSDDSPLDQTIGVCAEENTSSIHLEHNEFLNCARQTHSHWHLP